MPVNPTPSRQRVFTFLTPRIQDFLFYELKEGFRSEPPEYGTPHPDSKRWPNHKLCHIEQAGESGALDKWYYIAEREEQDAYNWSYSQADIGGNKFDSVSRTYVIPREDFDPASPAPGSAMPNVPVDLFTGSYVLAERKQIRSDDPKLDSLFIIEERNYVKRCAQRVIRDDDETESVLYVESNLYYGTEVVTGSTTASALFADTSNAYWGVTTTGLQREGQQLSCNWYLITTTQLVPSRTEIAITGSTSTGIPLRAYYTEKDYYWPAILRTDGVNTSFGPNNDLVFSIVPSSDETKARDRISLRTQFSNPAYRGATKMLIQEWWRPNALNKNDNPASSGGLPESSAMIPMEVEHMGVNFNARIEPTLHGAFSLTDTVGTTDPYYDTGDYSQTYPATSPYTDWPTSLIVSVDQTPWRSGYKITVVTAYRPDHYVATV